MFATVCRVGGYVWLAVVGALMALGYAEIAYMHGLPALFATLDPGNVYNLIATGIAIAPGYALLKLGSWLRGRAENPHRAMKWTDVLLGAGALAYFVLGLAQVLGAIEGAVVLIGAGSLLGYLAAGAIWWFSSMIPLAGLALCFWGAFAGWHWHWAAALLFTAPHIIFAAVGLLFGLIDMARARRVMFQS